MLAEELGQAMGYAFTHGELAVQAVTHASWANEHGDRGLCNERLEYLGDAVLELAVSRRLFLALPSLPEGRLTRLRAGVVSEPTLAAAALRMGLGGFLRLSRGELKTGGADKPAILADAFEALVGAVYLDGGFDAADGLIGRWLAEPLAQAQEGHTRTDCKTELQERLQSHGLIATYRILEETGPAHAARFLAAAMVGEEELARGWGASKKEAEQEAARLALRKTDSGK